MNSTKKNILMYGVVFFIFPIIIILILEVLLSVFFYTTHSKYFEDRLETNHRAGLDVRREFKSGSKDVSSQKLMKVAVFGGSSAAGYASPTSFAELLGNNELTGKNLVVDNYARSGEPFVGFQAELLKAVMANYDVIIVYNGHNEIWQQIYSRARKSHETIVLPNGYRIPFGSAPYVELERRLKRIKSEQASSATFDPIERMSLATNWLIDRSRLFWFANRMVFKALAVVPAFDPDRAQNYTPKFYYQREFISPIERVQLVDDFKQTINDIAAKLRPDQTLILSTEIVNNFYPPLAEVILNKDQKEVSQYEEVAKESYAKLAANDFVNLPSIVQNLPNGAHKTYLQARLCFNREGFKNANSNTCTAQADEARRLDKLPYRAVPDIHEFIRGFKAKNVIVIDPQHILNTVPEDVSQYFDYFVDFQHPSPKGHFVIADTILSNLFPDYRSQNESKVDECGNIILDPSNRVIKTSPIAQSQQFDINIGWLNNFIAAQPSPYPYDYFKKRAVAAKALCAKRSQ